MKCAAAGAWGSAVAIALAQRHDVLRWGRNGAVMAEMAAARDNLAYLPGCPFPPALAVGADFAAALAHASGPGALLIAACPVAGLRPLLEQLKGANGVIRVPGVYDKVAKPSKRELDAWKKLASMKPKRESAMVGRRKRHSCGSATSATLPASVAT